MTVVVVKGFMTSGSERIHDCSSSELNSMLCTLSLQQPYLKSGKNGLKDPFLREQVHIIICCLI